MTRPFFYRGDELPMEYFLGRPKGRIEPKCLRTGDLTGLRTLTTILF